MKKLILSILALSLCLSACKNNVSDEQLSEEYSAKTEAIMTDYRTQVGAIREDASLSEAQKEAKVEAVEEDIIDQLVSASFSLMKKHPKSPVAVEALRNIYYLADSEELLKVIGKLDDSLKEDEFVQQVLTSLQSRLNTAEGMMFTDFEIVQDENDPASKVSFSDYVGKGKYMLVDFWASWCGPCKGEMPNMRNVYAKYHGDDFDMLSVAVWDEPQATRDTAAVYGLVWNQIVNAQKIPTDLYGIDGIPHIILFGPDGKILKRDLRGAAIEEEVSKYVQAK